MRNLALNKPATQSSTSVWSVKSSPEEDARGANNGQISRPYGFHTDCENNPWWQVDLQDQFLIRRVLIYNRQNCEERLRYFSILKSLDAKEWQVMFKKEDSSVFGLDDTLPYMAEIAGDHLARYIRIRLDGVDFLHFSECQVFGEPAGADVGQRLIEGAAPAEQQRLELPPGRTGKRGSVRGVQRDRISVVIPLYNHARFIGEAVASVLNQGPIVGELIVVDDGSEDDSAAVMREISQRDSRIVFWSQPNRGAHAAINSCVWRATGDLVAILNSDDIYNSARLTNLANMLDADPSADIAASGISFIDAAGQPISNPWYDDALSYFKQCGDMSLALINGNFLMTTSNFLFRRRLLDEIGYFAPLRYAHDLDFALRALARRKRLVLAEEALLAYRMHDNNTINENHAELRLEWAMVTAAFLSALWHRGPIDLGYAHALEDILARHKLTLAVHLCMIYSSLRSGDTLERSPLLLDPAFRIFLIETLRSRSCS